MIIKNIEIPEGARFADESTGAKYPFSDLEIGAGFAVEAAKAVSAKSALSRYRKIPGGHQIRVAVLLDASLIMQRTA
jgi:hypothetical protein